jgi:hypothetical protein
MRTWPLHGAGAVVPAGQVWLRSHCKRSRPRMRCQGGGVLHRERRSALLPISACWPSNTVTAIAPNKLYPIIEQMVVGIVDVIGCLSDFRL